MEVKPKPAPDARDCQEIIRWFIELDKPIDRARAICAVRDLALEAKPELQDRD